MPEPGHTSTECALRSCLYSFVLLASFCAVACQNDAPTPARVDQAELPDANVEQSWLRRRHADRVAATVAVDAGAESLENNELIAAMHVDAAVDAGASQHADKVVDCPASAAMEAVSPPPTPAKTNKVFSLGNSYTGGAVIENLEGASEWDIYCGSSLDFIFHNPDGSCAQKSIAWTSVLDSDTPTIYDAIIFQTTPGELVTLATDTAVISYWMSRQPVQTAAVLQATWPLLPEWEAAFHGSFEPPAPSNKSLAYSKRLTDELKRRNPGRRVVYTRSHEMMDFIYHDSSAPFAFADLFRDESGHPTEIASYLHHNALRQALGQRVSTYPADRVVADNIRKYLDTVVAAFPPSP